MNLIKKIFLFLFISLANLCWAQIETPQTVLNAFNVKFPGSKVLEWEHFEGNYTASFFETDNYSVAIFDSSGNWSQSTKQITESQLPTKVMKCWKKKYKNIQFVSAILEISTPEKKPTYHISFESDSNLVNLVYSKRGKILSKFSEPIQLD